MVLSTRQKLLVLYGLRDLLFSVAMKKWREEGWVIQTHLTAARGNHYASVDEAQTIVHLYPHDSLPDQPPEKTLLHELGHILFEYYNGDSKREEGAVQQWEDLVWAVLRPDQRRQLRNLFGPSVPTDPVTG